MALRKKEKAEPLVYKLQHLAETDESGNAVPVEARIIEKRGAVERFTLNEVKGDVLAYDKKIKELEGMIELHEAKKTNVEQHHPFVVEMEEFDRVAVHTYQEACAMVEASKKALVLFTEQREECLKEFNDIIAQIPELAAVKVGEDAPGENANQETTTTEESDQAADTADVEAEAGAQ